MARRSRGNISPAGNVVRNGYLMLPEGTSDSLELNLLREWREPAYTGRILRAGIGSVLIHVAIIVVLIALPPITKTVPPPASVDVRKAVHLIAPKFYEPTQTAPNKGKVTRELDVRSSVPAPQRQAPRFRPPSPAPGPVAQSPPAVPAPVPTPIPQIEPPKIEASAAPPVSPITNSPTPAPPPPTKDKPKMAFESVGAYPKSGPPNPNSQVPLPKTSVQELAQSTVQPGSGGVSVGDIGDDLASLPSLSQPEAPGRTGSNLQLLSDSKGVDFKPYLVQVLAAVRRNWLAVYPQSARMGRRGRVLIQFIIDKQGAVPKLVIADASGTEAFDRAAVSGISASYPFPPLPSEYKGDQIRLQLTFSYNMPSR
jgi:TonB family protein